MIRNDITPAPHPGYEWTGEGRYAECPDHGSRLWWDEQAGVFYCPANRGHMGDPYILAPVDIYLEHDETWRVVNGCLWVDTYDEVDPDHECSAVDTPDGGIYCQTCARPAVHVLFYGWQHRDALASAEACERADFDSTGRSELFTWGSVSDELTAMARNGDLKA